MLIPEIRFSKFQDKDLWKMKFSTEKFSAHSLHCACAICRSFTSNVTGHKRLVHEGDCTSQEFPRRMSKCDRLPNENSCFLFLIKIENLKIKLRRHNAQGKRFLNEASLSPDLTSFKSSVHSSGFLTDKLTSKEPDTKSSLLIKRLKASNICLSFLLTRF